MFGADSDPGGALANYYYRPLVMIIGCYSNSPATTTHSSNRYPETSGERSKQVDYTLSGRPRPTVTVSLTDNCDCFSLKLECEKLASEKIEIQRHYVMVRESKSSVRVVPC